MIENGRVVPLGAGEPCTIAPVHALSELPPRLFIRGNTDLLASGPIAIFCSTTLPPELVQDAWTLARQMCLTSTPIIGGFQSAVERMFLEMWLGRGLPLIVTRAAGKRGARPRAPWRDALAAGRMLLVAGASRPQRLDERIAHQRNRLTVALAREVLVVHARVGGRVYRLMEEALGAGIRVRCMNHPDNEPLLLMGASPQPHNRWDDA